MKKRSISLAAIATCAIALSELRKKGDAARQPNSE